MSEREVKHNRDAAVNERVKTKLGRLNPQSLQSTQSPIFNPQSCFLLLLFFSPSAFAVQSLGEFSDTLMGPIGSAMSVIKFICAVVGAGMVMASIVKYKEYRQLTTDMSLGSIVTLLIIGLALIAVVFIPVL